MDRTPPLGAASLSRLARPPHATAARVVRRGSSFLSCMPAMAANFARALAAPELHAACSSASTVITEASESFSVAALISACKGASERQSKEPQLGLA